MTVNTKQVIGRRVVRYDSYAVLLEDARALAVSTIETRGNWSYGQILVHVALSLDSSIDGVGFVLPAPMRWTMTLLMKRKFLDKALPPGFKTSEAYLPPSDSSVEHGLSLLQQAVDRQHQESHRASHPAFGRISEREWTDFNLRHAEMHMSFVEQVL
ncbi:MAG: DUF1569 domain-containing protein [Planctomycetota bacterium]